MKIHYSPYYDGELFFTKDTNLMGVLYVGTKGLLEILKLRTGLHQDFLSRVEQETQYMIAAQKCASGSFFEKAFAVDAMGVAGKLLQWRDSLIMAGWDGTCNEEKSKLYALANIEKHLQKNMPADSWVKIHKALADGLNISDSISEIYVDCIEDEVPYLVVKTLSQLATKGIKVVFQETKELDEEKDLREKDVTIVEFNDVYDAYQWIAQEKIEIEDTVIVNRDNVLLNHVFYTWDKPLLNSKLPDANPQLLQIFKLGMSLFSRPLNVRNVLSYLQLPESPVPSELRYKLSKLLIDNGGFGDGEWEKVLEDYEYVDKEGEKHPKKTEEKKSFLAPIRNDYTSGIAIADLLTYISSIQKWMRGMREKAEFYELSTYFSSLEAALKALNTDTISSAELEKLVLQIYRSMSTSVHDAQKGALNVVDSIHRVVSMPKTLIWLDCQEEDIENNPYDFLSPIDIKYLQNCDVKIPDFASHLLNIHKARNRKLAEADKIILCKSAYNGITRLGEHSLIAEMNILGKTVVDKNTLFKIDKTTKSRDAKKVEQLNPVHYVQLDKIEYPNRVESYTSLDKFIQKPFNYVTEYVAKLYEGSNNEVADMARTKGNVAHYFFEKFIGNYCAQDYKQQDFAVWRSKLNEIKETLIEEAIDAVGLILRLPENTIEYNTFRKELENSILSLIDIMEHLKLSPVACELSIPGENKELIFPGVKPENNIKFGAKIDFLLINENNNYVIFDFKWTIAPNKYKKLITESKDIQLSLYKWAVEKYKGKVVVAVGYYLMAQAVLYTSDYTDYFKEKKKLINKLDRTNAEGDVLTKLKNSIAYRMKELEKGTIEEAELLDISETDGGYYNCQTDNDLLPLDVKDKTDIKTTTYVYNKASKHSFGEDKKTPNEVATTHKVMKGRLK